MVKHPVYLKIFWRIEMKLAIRRENGRFIAS